MAHNSRTARYGLNIVFPLTLAVLAVLAHGYNLLLFHTLAELFAIFVALMTSVVAWHTYRFSRNDYLMFLGLSYAFVGYLDLAHTLVFEGMPMFSFAGGNTSTQFWIAARLFEAVALLVSPLFLTRNFDRAVTAGLFAAVSVGFSVAIISGNFPVTYQNGLTAFKIGAEYLIIAMLFAAAAFLWQRRALLEKGILRLLLVSMAFTAAAELCFTGYINLSDVPLLAGHVLKFFSFWLIFLAVIRTTLTRPFVTMARGSSTYDAIPEAIAVVDEQGLIRQVNRAAVLAAGGDADEMVGKSCHELFHPPEIPSEDCPVCQAIIAREPTALELEFPATGEWATFTLSPIQAKSERAGMVHVFRDVTERRVAEDALRRAHDELELRIQERTADLVKTNQKLQAEILERQQMQEALVIAKEEAEAANRAKSDFLSRMSHELRTPLNAVLGFAQLMRADKEIAESDVQRDNVDQILKAGWHLLELIDEVLDLAKIESGRLAVNNTCVRLAGVLLEILEQSRFLAEERNVRVEYWEDETTRDVCVHADYTRLKQVMINLLSNAIKYNVNGGRVIIRVDKGEETVRIHVDDTGRGLSEDKIAQLFQPFNRLGAEHTEVEGTGIGLVICKRLMELMDGTISVASEPGRGSTFTVEFALEANCGEDCIFGRPVSGSATPRGRQ